MSETKRFKLGSLDELRFAMNLARKAHEDNQHIRIIGPDLGKSYFDTHVIRVIKAVPSWAKPAAALHDVEEDCGHFWRTQFQLDVSEETNEALKLLTRAKGETYKSYIVRICDADGGLAGRIARVVKLADLMDNLGTLPSQESRHRYIDALSNVAGSLEYRDEASWDL